ncbi:MAG: HAD-IA family hydrolase, partial [Patescibacteria group bacterium]
MRYRAVGFDYDGVLKGTPWCEHEAELAGILGVDVPVYKAAFSQVRQRGNPNLGELTYAEFWRRVTQYLGCPERAPAVIEANNRRVHDSQVNEPVCALVRELRIGGYRTGMLTNNTASAASLIQAEGFGELFDVVHISAVTGFVKPDAFAFEYFAQALGVDVHELVFIDDNNSSLRKAPEIGFAPILFESASQL